MNVCYPTGVVTHTLGQTEMCRPHVLLFHQKSLDMGPILVKILEDHISEILRKPYNISHFEVENHLEMGSNLQKFSDKKSYQPFLSPENWYG